MSSELTAEYVRSIFDYNPETGVLTWKAREDRTSNWNARYAGKRAGSLTKMGYIRISINDRDYMAHIIVWLYVYGAMPDMEIDHKNNDGSNNRVDNLRLSTRQDNERNKLKSVKNKTGFKGVFWDKRNNKWLAQIVINKKCKYLGMYMTPEEAHSAYCKAANELFGDFANAG
jgi:hypothetical protein